MNLESSPEDVVVKSLATKRRTMMFIDGGHLINLVHEFKLNPKDIDYGN